MAGRLRYRTLFVIAAVVLTLAACTGSDSTTGPEERAAAAYSIIIDDLLERDPVEPADGEELPIVFIESFSEEGIAIEVQVAVVSNLAEKAEVRFIDDVMEATDQDAEPYPVKPGAILIGVGPIPEAPVEVQVEWYSTSDDVEAYRYSLTPLGATDWTIAGERESTEPVGFVRPS